MKKIILLMTVAMMMAGCAKRLSPTIPDHSLTDTPPLNKVTMAELGDTLLNKADMYTHDAIVLENQVTAGGGISDKFTLNPGTLIYSYRDHEWECYSSNANVQVHRPLVWTRVYSGGLAFNKYNNDIRFCLFDKLLTQIKPNEAPVYSKTTVTSANKTSFAQEILYNGRSGDTIRLMYREFKDSYARPAFTQEMVYDLGESNIIGFKGTRIEVLEATNTKIKYKVIKSFP